MDITDMQNAIDGAELVIKRSRTVFRRIGQMLAGNLRHCYSRDLCRMKTELRDFNAVTCRWRNPGEK